MESNLARCFHVTMRSSTVAFGFGICTPSSCQEADVAGDLFAFMDLPRLTSQVPASQIVGCAVTELAPWRALETRIDFVIAGFPNSGTSTLAKTLQSHPEISLPSGEMDLPQLERLSESGEGWYGDWRAWLCADVLPRKWLDQKLPRPGPATVVRGFKQPLLLYGEDCIRHLARAMPKLLVAVRDPLEWLLSTLDPNATGSSLGQALHDWVPPSPVRPSRSAWFGREHARFGSLLEGLLRTWSKDRVMAIELEHLRHPSTAVVALDAACRFLGVRPFSQLRPPGTDAGAACSAAWGQGRFIGWMLRGPCGTLAALVPPRGLGGAGRLVHLGWRPGFVWWPRAWRRNTSSCRQSSPASA